MKSYFSDIKGVAIVAVTKSLKAFKQTVTSAENYKECQYLSWQNRTQFHAVIVHDLSINIKTIRFVKGSLHYFWQQILELDPDVFAHAAAK